MLHAHRWPGNVRELRNAVRRLLVTPEHLIGPTGDRAGAPPAPSGENAADPMLPLRIARREASDQFERRYLQLILERTGGNVSRAAAIAEVSRQMVQRMMKKHGVE